MWICSSALTPVSWVSPIDASSVLDQITCTEITIPAGVSTTKLSNFTRILRLLLEL